MLNKKLISSFDIIGSREKAVAIIENERLKGREKEIAEALLKIKNVKSVLLKTSKREGEYRLRKYKLLAGDADTEVVHKEYGYMLKLDPQLVYFSPREATERQRIAKQVKAGETVMVMFGGIAPFAIAIAKKQPEVDKIITIEINPDAARYASENIRINKLSHKIISIQGDVRIHCVKWYGKCDRVVMPLPLGSESFLNIAISCLKHLGIIHFYNWGREPNPFEKAERLIDKAMKKLNRMYEILNKHIVLPYAPRTYKVCLDVKIEA